MLPGMIRAFWILQEKQVEVLKRALNLYMETYPEEFKALTIEEEKREG